MTSTEHDDIPVHPAAITVHISIGNSDNKESDEDERVRKTPEVPCGHRRIIPSPASTAAPAIASIQKIHFGHGIEGQHICRLT